MSGRAPQSAPTANAFLDLFLPGTTPSVTQLKNAIVRLNEKPKLFRSVLILGESGAGKSFIARLIAMHRCWVEESFYTGEPSQRRAGLQTQKEFYLRNRGQTILHDAGNPYREVPLPTLEGPLGLSLLFGHAKGSFTDAKKDSSGFLGQASVTDVLLDEIGYASIEMQQRLLHVVQTGEYYRLGEFSSRPSSARLLFATNRDLQALVEAQKFQEDLLWRLTDYVIHVPPLRERTGEIRPFALAIVSDMNQAAQAGRSGEPAIPPLRSADLAWMEKQPWRGNLRELEKTIRRWYFFGGVRPIQEVWQEVQPYIPQSRIADTAVTFDKLKAQRLLTEKIDEALAKGLTYVGPAALIAQLFSDTRREAAQALWVCLEKQKVSIDELAKIFGLTRAGLRSWKSNNRPPKFAAYDKQLCG